MTVEINQVGEVEREGKKWLVVEMSFDAISGINKIAVDDKPDENSKADKLMKQVHKDCLELIKAFKS
jgi:hypothetical protein